MTSHSHTTTNYNIRDELPYERYDVDNVIEDTLFPCFLFQFKLKINNDKILEECYKAR